LGRLPLLDKETQCPNIKPAEGNGIFLGNNLNDYNARFITISVSYRPSLRRVARPAL